ncbi:MAG: right-handed parallel beta-helix repeat-containing protein [Thermoleophilaceae bacterium]|nr:right-handed parallel beta-helix repeat-containing protein [Thermoleophilaceae bacterium]
MIPCSQAGERVVLTSSARLDPSCSYTEGFEITASNVTLDCRGAVLDATGRGGNAGILVHTDVSSDLRRITIRNCDIRGFLNSIRITRDGFRGLAAGQEYVHGIKDVTIERTKVSGSRGVGLYVDGYVTRTTIRDTEVSGSGSSGIYLEAGSADNVVTRNWIHDNGFRENGPNGSNFSFGGAQFRFWGIGREGISIDGSRRNVVTANRFAGNSAGGIFLYTNCGEYVNSRPERWFQRRYGADDNVIAGNRFEGGVNGVWVGSRMGESTLPMECSDPAYVNSGLTRVALDRAANNTVIGNSFDDVTYGVRVEDDRTKVVLNRFSAPDDTHHAVVIGTPYRTSVLSKPVKGTVLVGNDAWIRGNRDPYRWVEGQTGTVALLNRSLGRRAGLCQGKTLPRGPFVMTIAFAVIPPGGPEPEPPPNLAAPVVGSLPAC